MPARDDGAAHPALRYGCVSGCREGACIFFLPWRSVDGAAPPYRTARSLTPSGSACVFARAWPQRPLVLHRASLCTTWTSRRADLSWPHLWRSPLLGRRVVAIGCGRGCRRPRGGAPPSGDAFVVRGHPWRPPGTGYSALSFLLILFCGRPRLCGVPSIRACLLVLWVALSHHPAPSLKHLSLTEAAWAGGRGLRLTAGGECFSVAAVVQVTNLWGVWARDSGIASLAALWVVDLTRGGGRPSLKLRPHVVVVVDGTLMTFGVVWAAWNVWW